MFIVIFWGTTNDTKQRTAQKKNLSQWPSEIRQMLAVALWRQKVLFNRAWKRKERLIWSRSSFCLCNNVQFPWEFSLEKICNCWYILKLLLDFCSNSAQLLNCRTSLCSRNWISLDFFTISLAFHPFASARDVPIERVILSQFLECPDGKRGDIFL